MLDKSGIRKTSLIGNVSINVQEDLYQLFFDQQAKNVKKSEKPVFVYDYQTFLWAFIEGIQAGICTPLEGKKKSPFKWEVIDRRQHISKKMFALVLVALYQDSPDAMKEDYFNETLSEKLRIAIEEFANTGLQIMRKKQMENASFYIDGENLVRDIF